MFVQKKTKTLKVHKIRKWLMQLKPFWHNIEQLQNKEVDIMSSNIENGGNDANAVDILQLVGKWLTTTEITIWQEIALENDKVQQIQDPKEKELQELQLQQTLQQIHDTGKNKTFTKTKENRALKKDQRLGLKND